MLTVRAATAAEVIAARRIHNACRSLAAWLPEPLRTSGTPTCLDEHEVLHVAVTAQAAVVGFITIHPPESFIHHLYVDPSCQRQGVGTLLLRSLDAWLPSPWRLKCVTANAGALRFYARHGWIGIGSGAGDEGPYTLLLRA
jgi:GNAT superfamily N-acetyltransferase